MHLMGEDSRELTGKVGWREGSGISKGPRVTVSAVICLRTNHKTISTDIT